MKEKLIAWMKTGKYSMHLIRALVGGYVVYLGGQVIVDVFKGEANGFWLIFLSSLQILIGAAIVGVSLWAVLGGHCADYSGSNPVDEDGKSAENEEKNEDS